MATPVFEYSTYFIGVQRDPRSLLLMHCELRREVMVTHGTVTTDYRPVTTAILFVLYRIVGN